MALKQSVEAYGTTFSEAYILVNTVTYNKGLGGPVAYEAAKKTSMSVLTYASKEARDNKADPILDQRFDFDTDMSGESAVNQAYAYLKTLDEFKNAEDA